MAMGDRQNARSKGNQASEPRVNDYECLTPLSKSVLLMFQVIQTVGLLVLTWVSVKGSDNWLGNLMPSPGIFVTLTLAFTVFVLLWVQRIKVLRNAK